VSFFFSKPIVLLQILWLRVHYWTWPPLIIWWALRAFSSGPKETLWSFLKQLRNGILYIVGTIDLSSKYRERLVDKFLAPRYPEYKYGALNAPDQIRLVQLRPTFLGGIQCEIIQVRLHDAPAYGAVSYTWGDGDKKIQSQTARWSISSNNFKRTRYPPRTSLHIPHSKSLDQLDLFTCQSILKEIPKEPEVWTSVF
jgi:hypothetical protein